jgi:HSP20 family molecular chaperone IbpA
MNGIEAMIMSLIPEANAQSQSNSQSPGQRGSDQSGAEQRQSSHRQSSQQQSSAYPPPPPPGRYGPPHSQRPYYSPYNDPYYGPQSYEARQWDSIYQEIERMQRDIDRMFDEAFNRYNVNPDLQNRPHQRPHQGPQQRPPQRPEQRNFHYSFHQNFKVPEMDVKEDADKYTVIVNLPGSDAKDVSVNLDGQRLNVRGEQRFEKQDKDSQGNVIFQERRSGSFQRSVTLPGPVKQAGMKTDVKNGVLTVTVPKDI